MAKEKKFKDSFIRFDSREDVEKTLARFAELDASVKRQQHKYNEDEQKRRAVLTETLAPVELELEKIRASVQLWCENNRQEFGTGKSIEFRHATVSFRVSPPSVKPRKGFTKASVLEIIKESGGRLVKMFIRTKEELDLDAIKKAVSIYESYPKSAEAISEQELETYGLHIVQDENFALEAKHAVEQQ